MSIVENALLRAKKSGGTPPRPSSVRDNRVVPEPLSDAAAEADNRTLATPVPQPVTVEFPLIAYDRDACARNHVLTPAHNDQERASAVAAYRMMRTRILQRMRANDHRILGITSPGPSEGKTLSSVNLALSIAQEGNNTVFLLDLDMRKPGLAPALGIRPTHELSRFFRGELQPQETLFSIGIDNLLIAAGNVAIEHSSELLANGKLADLLAYIRSLSSTAFIVIDLPPVVNADDALVVAPFLDNIVLVATEGKTRRDALARSLDVLREFRLGGLVLNRSHDSYGGEYYGY